MNISQTPADLSIDNTIELAVGLLTQAFHHEVKHSCPRDRPFSFAAATVKGLFAEAVQRGTADNVSPVVLALGAIDFGFEPDEGMTALTGLEVAIAWLDGPDPSEPESTCTCTCTCGCEVDEDRGYEPILSVHAGTTWTEATVGAIVLAMDTPTDEGCGQAAMMAETMVAQSGLTLEQAEGCKANALVLLEMRGAGLLVAR